MSSWRWLALGIYVVCLTSSAAAQSPGSRTQAQKRDEQRENDAVRKAQDHLKEVEKDLQQAEDEVRDAQQRVRQATAAKQAAMKAVQKTIDRLEDQHADLTGLTMARRDLKAAQTAFDEKAGPVRKSLESQADYQSSQQTIARVKMALKSAGDNDEIDRAQLAKDSAAALAKVREIEQTAFRRDPELAALQGKLDQLEKRVQQAMEKFEKAVERDGDLKASRKAFEEAKVAEDRAEQAVGKVAREMASVRMKVAQATQQLQQKKAQDQRDDNRGKNKGKK